MYILNKVSLSDVPISELNMIKLSEGIRGKKYDRVRRTSHKNQLHSMNFFMLEKSKSKGL